MTDTKEANMLAGKTVVVTGIVPGESRITAEKRLRDLGANTAKTVTGSIDMLITGAKVGPKKIATAKKLGIEIVPWEQAIKGDYTIASASGVVIAQVTHTDLHREVVEHRQIAPMLASNAERPPAGPEWLHEIKWDGVRCIATITDGAVSMQSRSNLTDYRAQYPEVAAELATLPNMVLDGEIVAADKHEGGSFQALRGGGGTATFVAFDILSCPPQGEEVKKWPLSVRRHLLEKMCRPGELIGVSPIWEDGDALLAYVAENGMEGIVSKRRGSAYQEGARNADWQKIKVRLSQEFVVLGWIEGEGSRAGRIGSILLGYFDEDGLATFCGRCGTGKTTIAGWDELRDRLTPARYGSYDLDVTAAKKPELKAVNWVLPEVVVQVEFQRWTEDGRLWHPSYQGIRDDKAASDVRREG